MPTKEQQELDDFFADLERFGETLVATDKLLLKKLSEDDDA